MAGTSAEGGGAGAIEKRCPICLEDFDDKTFIDACFHILLNTELCYCPEISLLYYLWFVHTLTIRYLSP